MWDCTKVLMDLMEIEVNRLEMLDYRLVMLVNKMDLLGCMKDLMVNMMDFVENTLMMGNTLVMDQYLNNRVMMENNVD